MSTAQVSMRISAVLRDGQGRRLVTGAEACTRVGVERATLHNWSRRGLVPRPERHAGVWLYDLDRVLDAEVRTAASRHGRRRVGA